MYKLFITEGYDSSLKLPSFDKRAHILSKKLNAHALKKKFQLLEKANAEMATFTAITGNGLKEPIKKVYTTLETIMVQDGIHLSNSSRAGLRRIQGSLNRIKLLPDDILSLSSLNSFNTTHPGKLTATDGMSEDSQCPRRVYKSNRRTR